MERQMIHRCPYRDEIDVGTVKVSWDGDTVELHDLAAHLSAWATESATHEHVTTAIADYVAGCGGGNVTVVSCWQTAGLAVTVTA